MNAEETFEALSKGIHIPRKEKLAWIGRKLSRNKIRRILNDKKVSPVCEICGGNSTFGAYRIKGNFIDEYCLRCRVVLPDSGKGA